MHAMDGSYKANIYKNMGISAFQIYRGRFGPLGPSQRREMSSILNVRYIIYMLFAIATAAL